VAGGASVVLMLAIGAAWLIWHTYERAVAEASTTAANLSTTLAAHVRQTLDGADRVLVDVVGHARPIGASDEAEFRDLYSSRAMFDALSEAASGVPQIDVISVAGTDGVLLNLTRSFPVSKVSVADRDYFQTAIKSGFTGMTLGKPVQNKVTGTWTFYIARQITGAGGRPLGVAQIGISVDFFQKFYRDINIGAGSAITLFRNDGTLLARAPARDELLGQSFASQAVFHDGIFTGLRSAVLTATDGRLADGGVQPQRLVAFRALDDLPVVVNTTLTQDMYLASWRGTALGIGIGTLVMATAIIALSLGLARMIGRLQASEAGLGAQRHMLAVTLNAMEQGIMLITADGRVPVCNQRARLLLELPETAEPRPDTLDAIIAQEGQGAAPPTGLGTSFELERSRTNGMVLRIQQMPLDDGGAVRIFTDVTRERKAEAHLRQAQKLDALGQLTAGIAHDFNNLLGVIISSVDLLSDPADLSDGELTTISGRVRDAALTAAELVRGMLNFSRQQEMKSEPTDLARLVKRSLPMLRQALASRLAIRTELPVGLWPVQVDAPQIESALLNLVLNARDAAPRDGLLRISAHNQAISGKPEGGHPPDLAPGDYVILLVIDRGTGMDETVRNRAYEPFFTTKDVGQGSGLGLSMVFGTMRQLRGAIAIDSQLGEGTTIRLYLPRALVAPSPPLRTPKVEAPVRRRILLVEDNAGLRETATSMLTTLGHEVVAAAEAAEAMSIWQTDRRFDLVFSDVIMPGGMNGVELVLALRDQAPDLKVLLTSGFSDPAGASETIRKAGLPLIQKPYRKADLIAHLMVELGD
jgi:signal transduction histidine kinase/CheY-like chemotaxis protein